jgi:hypothetical protein
MLKIFISAFLFGSLFGPWTQATTFMPVPFAERIQSTRMIVRATAGESRVDWAIGRDGSRRLYTFTQMTVREVIKDSPQRAAPTGEFVVREMGGARDGVGLQISGTARFAAGEDVVLMLGNDNPDGSIELSGMMMGRYGVQQEADGSELLVGAGMSEGKPETERWSLERVRQEVKRQAESVGQAGSQASSGEASSIPAEGLSGAPTLQSEAEAPLPAGSPEQSAGSGGRAWSWGLVLVAGLGLLGLWIARRSRR